MTNIADVIVENEALIYKIINKYRNHFELEDLYQVAVMGFIKASANYKEEYNTKFTTYAYPYILGEVLKYVNDYRSIKINKNNKSLYLKILKATEILTQKIMKVPTSYELSLFLEIDEQVIDEVINNYATIESLDKLVSSDDKNLKLYDKIGYQDSSIENYSLLSELDKLSDEERYLIKSRYYNDMSQKEVGEKLGMYQVEVSRKEKKILKKLYDGISA